ncbi:MAG: hypothetical protein AAF483_15175 [Planctomycetota bacterium]
MLYQEENPYAASEPSLGYIQNRPSTMMRPSHALFVVFGGYLGTALAGGLFGFGIAHILGLIVGVIWAGVVGLLPFLFLLIVSALKPESSLLYFASAVGGGLTGFLSVLPVLQGLIGASEMVVPVITTSMGFIGGLGGAALTRLAFRSQPRNTSSL